MQGVVGGVAQPAREPPTPTPPQRPQTFFYAQNAECSPFLSLALLMIHFN